MRSIVNGGAIWALAALAGCSAVNVFDKGPVVVDYHAGTTELSGYPKMSVGADNSFFDRAGSHESHKFGPFEVRQCNATKTACSLGLVILDAEMQILSVGDATAKLQIKIDYKVGAEWRRDVPGGVYVDKLTNPEIIHDQGSVSRVAEIAYGEVRHIELPYGLSYTVCVSAPGVDPMSFRLCAQQLNVKNPSSVPAF